MSKGEWKNNKIIYIIIISVCVILVSFFFVKAQRVVRVEGNSLPLENMKIECKDGEKITLEASVKKEKVFEKLSKVGFKIPPFFSFLPERVDVICDAVINIDDRDMKPSISILSMSLNGFRIPAELLSEIGELNLDFKRSLGYN